MTDMTDTTETGMTGAGAQLAANAVVADDIKDDIARFDRDGFVGPVKLYEPDEAAAMLREIRIKNQDYSTSIFKNELNYDRHFDIPELTRHIVHPTILEYLTAILGPDVLMWRSEFFAKFPGSIGTEWHQVRDYSYANGKPQLMPTTTDWNAYVDITVWTTFTPANRESGCMRFVRGSHRQRIFDEHQDPKRGREEKYDFDHSTAVTEATGFFGYDFSDFLIDPQWEPRPEDVVDVEMAPGEALIFTASCVHGSLPNITERETRFAITSRYVPTHVRVYPDQDSFVSHGMTTDLSEYGCVLVAGENRYDHNRMRDTNNLGQPFAR
jgi:non-haem Fe2+, alpha-ketoglutarate-dependent halogenase